MNFINRYFTIRRRFKNNKEKLWRPNVKRAIYGSGCLASYRVLVQGSGMHI